MLRFLPAALFALLAALFATALLNGRDPSVVPSALVGKPLPDFAIEGLSSADLRAAAAARPVLVNFFASWCLPCRAEQPVLKSLAGGVRIYGIAYKDKKPALDAFLSASGNPFVRLGHDGDGRAGILWGITGVPETFVIGRDGTVLYRYSGPLTPRVYQDIIAPLLKGGKT